METNPKPIIAEKIHLIGIVVNQQKIDTQKFSAAKNPALNVAHRVMHNLEERKIKMEMAFSFDTASENQLLFFSIDFHFVVDNFDDFYNLNESKIPVFDGNLIATLLGISLSTARGIIFEKLQNAGLKNMIIPVVSPQRLIK